MAATTSPKAKALQEKKIKKLIELIKKYNKGFKTVSFPELIKQAGFPATTGFNRPVTFYNRYPDAPRLNSKQTQVNKAIEFLLDEKKLNKPAINFKDFRGQIAKLTGLPTGGRGTTQSSNLSYYLQQSPLYKEFEKPLNYINVPASRLKTIQRGKNFTFADVVDMYSTKAPETVSRGFTAYEQPSAKIFDYAKRHVNLGGKKIKFLNENEFLYKGKKYDKDFLSTYGRKDKNFKEFFKAFDQRRNLFFSEVKHPVTGEKVKFKDVLEESYGTKNTLDIDHIKGIKNEPFTNLRVIPTRINQAAGTIKQKAAEAQAGLLTKTADDYTPDKVDQMLKKIGYGFTKGAKKLKEDELKLAEKVLKGERELRTPITIAKEAVNNFVQKVKSVPGGCRAVVTAALGGPIDACEAIIKADPKAAAVKLNNAITATKGPLKELKKDSQKLANLIDTGQVTTADKLPRPEDTIRRDMFKDANLRYNSELGAFENVKTQTVAPQAEIKQYAVDNPMEVKVGEPAKLPKPNKSVLKTVGKTLAAVGAPLPTALLDTYFINEQVKQDKTTSEIVSNPLNWLGLATMSPLSRAAGIDKAGKVNTALRLGLNPGTIRGISRFVGLPGLALSTAMTAYDQYTKYKNQEGFIYKMFNKEES